MKIERTKEPQKCSCGEKSIVCLTTDDSLKIYMCVKCFTELSDQVFGELMELYFESQKLKGN